MINNALKCHNIFFFLRDLKIHAKLEAPNRIIFKLLSFIFLINLQNLDYLFLLFDFLIKFFTTEI